MAALAHDHPMVARYCRVESNSCGWSLARRKRPARELPLGPRRAPWIRWLIPEGTRPSV